MKVLLMMADANMHKFWILGRLKSAREAPLTLTTLAAIGGGDPDIEFHLVDESVDSVPLDYPADLVGISVLTGTARRAYALAAHFRSRGIPVVLGGAQSPSFLKRPRATRMQSLSGWPKEPGRSCSGISRLARCLACTAMTRCKANTSPVSQRPGTISSAAADT